MQDGYPRNQQHHMMDKKHDRRQRKNHPNVSQSQVHYAGDFNNEDDPDGFYEPMDKSMTGYGGHMGGQNYPYYSQRNNNYRYEDYNYMDSHRMDGPWHDKQYDSYRNKQNIQTFSLNYQH